MIPDLGINILSVMLAAFIPRSYGAVMSSSAASQSLSPAFPFCFVDCPATDEGNFKVQAEWTTNIKGILHCEYPAYPLQDPGVWYCEYGNVNLLRYVRG